MLGSEVSFQLRRRGGLRCAANIRTLAPGSIPAATEQLLPELCTALVTEAGQVVLLDVSAAPLLSKKYLDLRVMAEAASSIRRDASSAGNGNGSSSAASNAKDAWSKVTLSSPTTTLPLPPSPPTAAEEGTEPATGANAGAATSTSPPAAGEEEIDAGTEAGDVDLQLGSPTAKLSLTGGSGGDAGAAVAVAVDYQAKYFPVLPRTQIPLTAAAPAFTALDSVDADASSSTTTATTPQVGTVVQVQVSVKWPIQRTPLSAAAVAGAGMVATECRAMRLKGRISRFKFRVKAPTAASASDAGATAASIAAAVVDEEHLQCYNIPNIEFVEFSDISIMSGGGGGGDISPTPSTPPAPADTATPQLQSYYYCEAQELQTYGAASEGGADHFNRELPQHGDEVEFFAIVDCSGGASASGAGAPSSSVVRSASCIAFRPRLLPRPKDHVVRVIF